MHRLVGQRARTRDHADPSGLVDVARHNAYLALAGGNHAGTVGADQPRLAVLQVVLDLYHVEHRDTLGDADDEFHSGGHRFEDRVGGERRRHVDHGRVGAGRFARLLDGIENRNALEVRAALARHHTADHLRAVVAAGARVELAGGAGDALGEDAGVLVYQNAHRINVLFADRLDHAARRVGHVVGGDHLDARLGEDLLALFDVGPFHADHQRDAELDLARRVDHAARQHVALHDAAEDVDQHRLDARVGEQDAEGRGDLLRVGAAADVEKVGRLGAVVLNDIHRSHRQARAVDHAADVAVEMDVTQIVLGGLGFGR